MNLPLHVRAGDLNPDDLHASRRAGRVAWDIETSGLDWRTERIGTCQLHVPEHATVVVRLPQDGTAPDGLRALLADQTVVKVFHHAMFDLRFMSHHWDVPPSSITCTKIAAKLLRPAAAPADHSLAALVRNHLGLKLDKTERTSDWLADELTPAQYAYAAADVQHLLPLLDRLHDALDREALRDLYEAALRHIPTRVRLDLAGYDDIYTY